MSGDRHGLVHTEEVPAAFALGVIAAFLGLALLMQHVLQLHAARLQGDRSGSRVWLVYLQRSAQFLVVDGGTVALADGPAQRTPSRIGTADRFGMFTSNGSTPETGCAAWG